MPSIQLQEHTIVYFFSALMLFRLADIMPAGVLHRRQAETPIRSTRGPRHLQDCHDYRVGEPTAA